MRSVWTGTKSGQIPIEMTKKTIKVNRASAIRKGKCTCQAQEALLQIKILKIYAG